MPPTTQSRRSRPPGAPLYYLGRPSDWWITALLPQPHGRLPEGSPADPLTSGEESVARADQRRGGLGPKEGSMSGISPAG